MSTIQESPQNLSQQVLFLMQCPDDARAPAIREELIARVSDCKTLLGLCEKLNSLEAVVYVLDELGLGSLITDGGISTSMRYSFCLSADISCPSCNGA